MALTPAGASVFERLVARLGLSSDQYKDSTVLREWARKNKNDHYVPSELLQAWGFTVETGLEPGRGLQRRVHPHMPLN